ADAAEPEGHHRRHVLEAGTGREATGRDAEVVQDEDGIVPAEGDRLVAEAHLDTGALRVVAHLLRAGLADVDDGPPLQMIGGDPMGHHAVPPCPARGPRPRRAAVTRPTLGSAPSALGRPARPAPR